LTKQNNKDIRKELYMKKYIVLALVGIVGISYLMVTSGCTKKEKTVGGVLIGAGTGALIGGAAGGGGGAAIGAVVGGAGGGIIGHSLGDDK
jgi:uncharacterized protein YcfJ